MRRRHPETALDAPSVEAEPKPEPSQVEKESAESIEEPSAEPSPDGPVADLDEAHQQAAEGDESLSDAPFEPSDDHNEDEITTERIIEALLLSSEEPIAPAKIAQVLGVGNAGDVQQAVDKLNQTYAAGGASFRIEFVAKGYQILTLPVFDRWIHRLHGVRKESRLSAAALETLAVVAYKQPVLRAEIESIRGVACGDSLNRLREMDLVKIVGRAEEIGRPMLYGTTKRFLEVFGLGSLDQLPDIEEVLPKPVVTSPPPETGEAAPSTSEP